MSQDVETAPAGISRGEAGAKRVVRAAVTGATGFVGSHLVEWLTAQGHSVRAICRPTSDTSRLEAADVTCEVVDWESVGSLASAVDGCDMVFHLAAVTHSVRREAYYRCNTDCCGTLAEACARQVRPPRMVLCSTIAAWGPAPRAAGHRIAARSAPVSHYGRSKRGGELAAIAWADRVPVTIVRPGIVFGPRNRELLPLFRLIYRLRLHVSPSIRTVPLSWIDVRDLVEILWRAGERGRRVERAALDGPASDMVQSGVYYATAPEWPSYFEFGRRAARALNRGCLLLGLPQPLPWIGALIAEAMARLGGTVPSLTLDKMREASAGPWRFRDDRLESGLGFRFRYSLQERLEQTVRWYLHHGWL